MSLYAIGDIHGNYDSLVKLFLEITLKDFNYQKDKMIFLGDYIDRGEKSYEVISSLLYLKERHPENFILLLGNHENMAIESNYLEDNDMWFYNGGLKTVNSYKKHENLEALKIHIKFFNTLSLYHFEDGYFFSHAGVNPYKIFAHHEKEDFIWQRECCKENKMITFDNFKIKPKYIIFGHTPLDQIYQRENRICIDTGACFEGGKLSAIKLKPNGKGIEKIYSI